jgi:hypothetical protein
LKHPVVGKIILKWIFRKLGLEGVGRINLAWDRDKKWAAVNTPVKFRGCF